MVAVSGREGLALMEEEERPTILVALVATSVAGD
jgi:hypothetical protein